MRAPRRRSMPIRSHVRRPRHHAVRLASALSIDGVVRCQRSAWSHALATTAVPRALSACAGSRARRSSQRHRRTTMEPRQQDRVTTRVSVACSQAAVCNPLSANALRRSRDPPRCRYQGSGARTGATPPEIGSGAASARVSPYTPAAAPPGSLPAERVRAGRHQGGATVGRRGGLRDGHARRGATRALDWNERTSPAILSRRRSPSARR